jgi:hypothetical protein
MRAMNQHLDPWLRLTDEEKRALSFDELMAIMPEKWRERWCSAEVCGCMGCVNGSGHLESYGHTKEDWVRWRAQRRGG